MEANITFQWKIKNTKQSRSQTYSCYHFNPTLLITDLKLFPTYWKSPARRSRASWRSQSPLQTVPGSSPCVSCQRMKRTMRSGGNYAPIGTQRSWSHSWVAKKAGQAEEERRGKGERGGGRQFTWLLWDPSRRLIELKDTCKYYFFLLFCPLIIPLLCSHWCVPLIYCWTHMVGRRTWLRQLIGKA